VISIDFSIKAWKSRFETKRKARKPGAVTRVRTVPAQLLMIRHAPVAVAGHLYGRTDVEARIDPAAIAALTIRLGPVAEVITSPARRCRSTAEALWPRRAMRSDARLWEQDFGDQEGLPFADLPDLGPMTNADLAAYAPQGGESFYALCARVAPAIQDYAKIAQDSAAPLALVVHAGVIRATLASVLGGAAPALAFEIGNLSVTRLRVGESGVVSAMSVNQTWT
jgi:alpha-ribazole phosphatase